MQLSQLQPNPHMVELEHFKSQVDARKARMKGSFRQLAIAFAIAWWPGLIIIAVVKACRVFWYEKEAFEITFTSHLLGTAIFAGIVVVVWLAWMVMQLIAFLSDRSDQQKLMWEAMMGMQRELNEARASQYPPPPPPPPSPPAGAPPVSDPATTFQIAPMSAPSQSPTPSDRTVLTASDHNLTVRFIPPTIPLS